MTTAYPLQWPAGRTRNRNRERSRFKVPSFAVCRDALVAELRMLAAKNAVLSTNIPLRNNGLPYASYRTPDDPGVAVYFTYKGKQMCFACDRWDRIEDNMRAVQLTIAALRGIARWGSGDMLEAAFTGFAALPPPMDPNAAPQRNWWDVLGVTETTVLRVCEDRYRALAAEHHPDKGGNPDKMAELNAAIRAARREHNA